MPKSDEKRQVYDGKHVMASVATLLTHYQVFNGALILEVILVIIGVLNIIYGFVLLTTQFQPESPLSRSYQSDEYHDAETNEVIGNTNPSKAPAISLKVAGGLLAAFGLAGVLVAFIVPISPSSFAFMLLLGIVYLALSAVVIFGAVSLLNQESYGWSMAGAISAIAGGVFLGLLGWMFVVPVGIWVLIVLRKPEVKRLFSTDAMWRSRP